MIVSGHPPLLGELEQLERTWPDAQRLLAAFTIALDLAACADLLAGRPVDEARLDPVELERARSRMLVLLSPATDLLRRVTA